MKKTLLLLLTLVIAISMTFVACDNQVKAQDKGSSESTDPTPVVVVPFDETTGKAVEEKNAVVTALVKDSTEDLNTVFKDMTKLSLIGEQKAESGKTFTLVSADVLNDFMEKNTGEESNLTPNQYEYIKTEVGFTQGKSSVSDNSFTLVIKYKVPGKEEVTFDDLMEYLGSNDQLLLEMFALTGIDKSIISGGAAASKSLSFKNTITELIKNAATSPTATLTMSISDGTNTYAISWKNIMNGKDRTLTLNDVFTLSKNTAALISLDFDGTITFSKDFNVVAELDFDAMQATGDPEYTGAISVTLNNVEIKIADRFVFTGKASAEIDYTNKTAKADVSFVEKIDGKEYLSAEFSIAGPSITNVEKLSEALTIKSLEIEGVSYDPESVLEYIKIAEENSAN